MKSISKFFCLGIMVLSLAAVTSCSDDDDNDNSAIVYGNRAYSSACSKTEAQEKLTAATRTLFSSAAIDTTDFFPFIHACTYFNNTYLLYTCQNGEIPFMNVLTSIGKLMDGDMSGLSDVIDRYKRYAGVYEANATNKTWDKIRTEKSRIAFTFKDSSGVDMQAVFAWQIGLDGSPNDTVSADRPNMPLNIISIIDGKGNTVTDTIPNKISLSITGGKYDVNFSSITSFQAQSNMLKLYSSTLLGNYNIDIVRTLTETTQLTSTLLTKGGATIASISGEIQGKNLISSIKNPANFTKAQVKSYEKVSIGSSLCMEIEEDTKKIVDKRSELSAAGKTAGTEEYVKEMAATMAEARHSAVYLPESNTYLFSIVSKPYHDATNNIWTSVPYITLYDNSSYSLSEFDSTGSSYYLMTKLQRLLTRMLGFFGSSL